MCKPGVCTCCEAVNVAFRYQIKVKISDTVKAFKNTNTMMCMPPLAQKRPFVDLNISNVIFIHFQALTSKLSSL